MPKTPKKRGYCGKAAAAVTPPAKKAPNSVAAWVDLCGYGDTPVYKFKMEGHCQAQARPKPGRNHGKFYDPSGADKKKLAKAIAEAMPKGKGALFPDGPVELKVWFLLEQPVKNFVGHDPSSGVLKKDIEDTFIACIRPDIDNLLKFVMDAMNGIVYSDDCQIAKVTMRKIRSKTREAATIVHVSECVETHDDATILLVDDDIS